MVLTYTRKRALHPENKKISKPANSIPVRYKGSRRATLATPAGSTSDDASTLIPHPETGSNVFVEISSAEKDGIFIRPGPAYLLSGWHGPTTNAGEGAKHILSRHGHETDPTCASVKDVAQYVAKILTDRACIFVGHDEMGEEPKIVVVNPKFGKVVMYPDHSEAHFRYVILTAYPDRFALQGFVQYEKKGFLIGPLFPK